MLSLEKKSFEPLRWFIPAILVAAGLNLVTDHFFRLPYPDISALKLSAEDAVQNASLITLGMRRLAADLSFIQLMMYYGTSEDGHGDEQGKGLYPELPARAMRILDLDPYFTYAALYASGALAFNMDRPDDALVVLNKAIERDPRQWKYRAYIAAIGFSKKGDPERVLTELSPVLLEPDCPVMLKSMLAFLNARFNHREEAIRIYKEILQSKDHSYDHIARAMLHNLRAPGW